jgi:uncharacterized protein
MNTLLLNTFTPACHAAPRRAWMVGVALMALAAASSSVWAQDGQPQRDLPRISLQAGMHKIDAQVAHTSERRSIGLMWRRDMPQHEGMLFVFEQPAVQCFWMKNTPTPLTAAFVADDGTIVNLADMQPLAETSHCSSKPVRFVLEMNQGWFDKRGMKPGFKLLGSVFTP